jgi:hypothetical protein
MRDTKSHAKKEDQSVAQWLIEKFIYFLVVGGLYIFIEKLKRPLK